MENKSKEQSKELGDCYKQIHELEYQIKKLELENRILRDYLKEIFGGKNDWKRLSKRNRKT